MSTVHAVDAVEEGNSMVDPHTSIPKKKAKDGSGHHHRWRNYLSSAPLTPSSSCSSLPFSSSSSSTSNSWSSSTSYSASSSRSSSSTDSVSSSTGSIQSTHSSHQHRSRKKSLHHRRSHTKKHHETRSHSSRSHKSSTEEHQVKSDRGRREAYASKDRTILMDCLDRQNREIERLEEEVQQQQETLSRPSMGMITPTRKSIGRADDEPSVLTAPTYRRSAGGEGGSLFSAGRGNHPLLTTSVTTALPLSLSSLGRTKRPSRVFSPSIPPLLRSMEGARSLEVRPSTALTTRSSIAARYLRSPSRGWQSTILETQKRWSPPRWRTPEPLRTAGRLLPPSPMECHGTTTECVQWNRVSAFRESIHAAHIPIRQREEAFTRSLSQPWKRGGAEWRQLSSPLWQPQESLGGRGSGSGEEGPPSSRTAWSSRGETGRLVPREGEGLLPPTEEGPLSRMSSSSFFSPRKIFPPSVRSTSSPSRSTIESTVNGSLLPPPSRQESRVEGEEEGRRSSLERATTVGRGPSDGDLLPTLAGEQEDKGGEAMSGHDVVKTPEGGGPDVPSTAGGRRGAEGGGEPPPPLSHQEGGDEERGEVENEDGDTRPWERPRQATSEVPVQRSVSTLLVPSTILSPALEGSNLPTPAALPRLRPPPRPSPTVSCQPWASPLEAGGHHHDDTTTHSGPLPSVCITLGGIPPTLAPHSYPSATTSLLVAGTAEAMQKGSGRPPLSRARSPPWKCMVYAPEAPVSSSPPPAPTTSGDGLFLSPTAAEGPSPSSPSPFSFTHVGGETGGRMSTLAKSWAPTMPGIEQDGRGSACPSVKNGEEIGTGSTFMVHAGVETDQIPSFPGQAMVESLLGVSSPAILETGATAPPTAPVKPVAALSSVQVVPPSASLSTSKMVVSPPPSEVRKRVSILSSGKGKGFAANLFSFAKEAKPPPSPSRSMEEAEKKREPEENGAGKERNGEGGAAGMSSPAAKGPSLSNAILASGMPEGTVVGLWNATPPDATQAMSHLRLGSLSLSQQDDLRSQEAMSGVHSGGEGVPFSSSLSFPASMKIGRGPLQETGELGSQFSGGAIAGPASYANPTVPILTIGGNVNPQDSMLRRLTERSGLRPSLLPFEDQFATFPVPPADAAPYGGNEGAERGKGKKCGEVGLDMGCCNHPWDRFSAWCREVCCTSCCVVDERAT